MATNNLITKLFDRILIQPSPIERESFVGGGSGSTTAILKAGIYPSDYYEKGTLVLTDSLDIFNNTFTYSWILYLRVGESLTAISIPPENVTVTTSSGSGWGLKTTETVYPEPYHIDSPNIGWNAAALSNEAFNGNGEVAFSCPVSSTGVVAGINEYSGRLNSNYSDINHGFIMRSGKYQIIEGNTILAGEAAFIEADVFNIRPISRQIH